MKLYKQYCKNFRLLSLAGIFSVILILIILSVLKSKGRDPLKVQFAYPVMFPNPLIYDDWQTVFVGNHIYRRLVPDEDHPWIPSITEDISLHCESEDRPSFEFNCNRIKMEFTPASFFDCMGRLYNHEEIESEFIQLVRSKPWIFPNAELCKSKPEKSVCLTFDKVPDPIKRTRALMFRFGWSKGQITDPLIGSGPYCLTEHGNSNDKIESGTLVPTSSDLGVNKITFYTSQNEEDVFDIALYGSTKLAGRRHRKNVHTNTPLPLYVVTNPKHLRCTLPWNSAESRRILREHLSKSEVIYQEIPLFLRFLPDGKIPIINDKAIKQCDGTSLAFHIPDYIPNCEDLQHKLNQEWNSSNFTAKCASVMDFLEFKKHSKWGGFLVGVSPLIPGKTAILEQYFSPLSPESWTGTYGHPEDSFYLLGMGQSILTVNKEKICDVRSNSMGLGNILIDDFIQCK